MSDFPEVESYKPCEKPEEHWEFVRLIDEAKVASPYWPMIQAGFFGLITLILLCCTIRSFKREKIDFKKKE